MKLLGLAGRKVEREAFWTVVIIAILTAGAMASIASSSIGLSLESGLGKYADAVATYIVVQNNNNPEYSNQRIPESVIEQINLMQGVEAVYPVATAYTHFIFSPNVIRGYGTVGNQTYPIMGGEEGLLSSVIGGRMGFPRQLLVLESGVIPGGNTSGFILNSLVEAPTNFTKVQIAGVNITAAQVGVNSYIPLVGNNLPVLWDADFVRSILGNQLFNDTYGENAGTSFLIIKANSINLVPSIAASISRLLSSYPGYNVQYDQSTIDNLLSFEAGTTPFYILLGAISIGTTTIAFVSVAFVAVRRRQWETALLIVQGWKWKQVLAYLSYYFLILALVSYSLALLGSLTILRLTSETFQAYGGYISVPASFNLPSALGTAAAVFLLTGLLPLAITRGLRRHGLESALREY